MELSSVEREVETVIQTVPYIVHEGAQARSERTVKRLIIVLVITIAMFFASNLMWMYYLSGYDIESYEYTQDGAGTNILGDGNGVTNYEPTSGSEGTPQEEPAEG